MEERDRLKWFGMDTGLDWRLIKIDSDHKKALDRGNGRLIYTSDTIVRHAPMKSQD